ncbi:MAG TPA: hypothetical protein VLJ59_18225 [Mycobacteriales bacterium]|nr:hypothetical protein [Mycobacteriales bacterium]
MLALLLALVLVTIALSAVLRVMLAAVTLLVRPVFIMVRVLGLVVLAAVALVTALLHNPGGPDPAPTPQQTQQPHGDSSPPDLARPNPAG